MFNKTKTHTLISLKNLKRYRLQIRTPDQRWWNRVYWRRVESRDM